MKKAISIFLAVCLTCIFGGSVFAVDTTLDASSPSGGTLISVVVGPTYEISVPASMTITFGDTAPQTLTITAISLNIPSTENVTVAVSTSTGSFSLLNGTNSISYDVSKDQNDTQAVTSGDTVATFTTSSATTSNIYVTIPTANWPVSPANGTYSQPLIFTLAYSGTTTP
ncbi:MAG: hypothetical protein FWD71_21370 [Oscillospiraceae bacterium]|nr:hypothetical protein [Oscillospiraceae bacterium]